MQFFFHFILMFIKRNKFNLFKQIWKYQRMVMWRHSFHGVAVFRKCGTVLRFELWHVDHEGMRSERIEFGFHSARPNCFSFEILQGLEGWNWINHFERIPLLTMCWKKCFTPIPQTDNRLVIFSLEIYEVTVPVPVPELLPKWKLQNPNLWWNIMKNMQEHGKQKTNNTWKEEAREPKAL